MSRFPGDEQDREDCAAASAPAAQQASGLFPALKERDFRDLWLGMLPGVLGVQMNFFTNGYLAFELTGSAKAIGFVSLAFGVPMLLLSLIGGMAADRYSKRSILLATQVVTTVMSLIMALLVFSDLIRIWHMVLVSLVMGCAFTFHVPARQSFIGELTSPKRLVNAIALNGAGLNACRVIGPPLAGWLISKSWMGVEGVYAVIAVMSAMAVVSLVRIADRGAHPEAGNTPRLAAVKDGLAYIRSHPILVVLLILSIAPIVLGMPYQALMPVFAKRVFDVGPRGLGLLMMASGIGSLVGALVIATVRQLMRPGLVQLFLGVAFGLGLAVFALLESFHTGMAVLFVVGVVSSSYLALNATLIMDVTDRRYHGRVMSVYMLTFSALPIGNMIMGAFADVFSAPATVGVGGILLAVVVALFGLLSPSYRGMRYGSGS